MLSNTNAATLIKMEKARLLSPYNSLTEPKKFDYICQLALEKNIIELEKIVKNSLSSLNIQQNGHTPLSLLAFRGEHEAVALLIRLGGSVEWAIYGYAYGGHIQQAAKWMNAAVPAKDRSSKNPGFKYIRSWAMKDTCRSFARGLVNGERHSKFNVEHSLSLIVQPDLREKLAKELGRHMGQDPTPILSLPRANKVHIFMNKYGLSFNETMSLSIPGFYGWMIYGTKLVQEGRLEFSMFCHIANSIYALTPREIENISNAMTFSTSYHGRKLFETICQLAQAKDAVGLKKIKDHGANLNIKVAMLTPASFLASQGNHEAVDFLVQHGVSHEDLFSNLTHVTYSAAVKGEMETVRNCLYTLNRPKTENYAVYYLYDELLIKEACKGFADGGHLINARKAEQVLQNFVTFKQLSKPLYSTIEQQIKCNLPVISGPLSASIGRKKFGIFINKEQAMELKDGISYINHYMLKDLV
ncbi:hypothetical protein [Legionella sp. WA2022007384]